MSIHFGCPVLGKLGIDGSLLVFPYPVRLAPVGLLILLLGACSANPPRIHNAIKNHESKEALQLIKESGNIEETDKRNQTALHFAAELGPIEVVDALIAKGADIHARRDDGSTPLIMACVGGHLPIVKRLLDGGSQIYERSNGGGDCLYNAAHRGYTEVVRFALEEGVSPNRRTYSGWTPLHVAAEMGETEVVSILIAAGADVHLQASNGYTPYDSAAANERKECALALLAAGSGVNSFNKGDGKPDHYKTAVANIYAGEYYEGKGIRPKAVEHYTIAWENFEKAAEEFEKLAEEKAGKISKGVAGDFLLHLLAAATGRIATHVPPAYGTLESQRKIAVDRAKKARMLADQCRDKKTALKE